MIVGNDVVPHKTQGTGQRIADNRAAQVTDMHGFGDVGRAIVYDKGERLLDNGHTESLIFSELLQFFGQPTRLEA
ncbi:hypothetical protein HRbin36_01024 [bacterium HR36]|nr:hypothetical protein HRbin36_01024 [bacterium HR36]